MKRDRSAIGNCYERAGTLLFFAPDGAMLCHGIGRMTKPPHVLMGHAWIEIEVGGIWYVRDVLYPQGVIRRDDYYRVGQVSDVVRYDVVEGTLRMYATGHYGPWDKKIAAAAHAGDEVGA